MSPDKRSRAAGDRESDRSVKPPDARQAMERPGLLRSGNGTDPRGAEGTRLMHGSGSRA